MQPGEQTSRWRVRRPRLVVFAVVGVGMALGWAWLAAMLGAERAFALGVVPFLLGAVVKSGLGAALLGASRLMPRRA